MVSYGKLRNVGNPEVMPVNHFVRGSSPCWGAKIQNGRFSPEKRPFVFGIECCFLQVYQMVFYSLAEADHPSKYISQRLCRFIQKSSITQRTWQIAALSQ
jgi:hypothetical protein